MSDNWAWVDELGREEVQMRGRSVTVRCLPAATTRRIFEQIPGPRPRPAGATQFDPNEEPLQRQAAARRRAAVVGVAIDMPMMPSKQGTGNAVVGTKWSHDWDQQATAAYADGVLARLSETEIMWLSDTLERKGRIASTEEMKKLIGTGDAAGN